MKELLQQYAKYNIWANKRIIEILLKLDETSLQKEITSSFSSIQATVCHIWAAEDIWLQRLQLAEHPVWRAGTFAGTFDEACSHWQKASEGLLQFVERQYDDKALQHVFQYYNVQKHSYKLPVFTALNHVFNHSTQHRGQLMTMMRQVGITKIPPTDLSFFATNKQAG